MSLDVSSRPESRRVLVTGASGFIGRRIVRSFLDRGWQVTAAVHKTPLPAWMAAVGVGQVGFTIDDLQPLTDAVRGAQAICHAAAFMPADYGDSKHAAHCLQVNALFTLRLAELALEQPKLRFVHLSSAQGYDSSSNTACEEGDRLYPADRATYYLTSKLAGELFVEHLRRTRGLCSVGLRVGSCYGSGMPSRSVVSIFLERARSGQTIEVHDGGKATCDYVHVDDVARVAALAAESGEPGMYNMGSGTASSLVELARAAAGACPDMHVPIQVHPASENPARGFAALSMQKTNSTWNHRPTKLRMGLAAMRRILDEEDCRNRAA